MMEYNVSVEHLSQQLNSGWETTKKIDECYQTDFSWNLRNWKLLDDPTYLEAVQSDSFQLHGINDRTCRLSIQKRDPDNCLMMEFSDFLYIKKMNIIMKINHNNEYEYSWKHHVPRIISFRNSLMSKSRVTLSDAFKKKNIYGDTSLSINIIFSIEKCPESEGLPHEKSVKNIPKHVQTMFKNKTLCDVTFVCDGKELTAHKAILAVQSEVFERMFQTAMKERETNKVEITDIGADIFEVFLKFLYTGELNDLKNIAHQMLVVADKYQVHNLKELCETFMLSNLHTENAVEYFLTADQLSCTQLKKKAYQVLRISAEPLLQVFTGRSFQTLKRLKQVLVEYSVNK